MPGDHYSISGERLEARADAEAIRAACDGQAAIVLSVEKKEKSEAPPKLYDLTALQRDANRLLGYTAQQTLDMAQALYEKKLLTYPRTDSRYLTEDMASGLKELVNLTAMRLPFIKVPLPVNAALVIDNKKVSDHHALIPTRDAKDADFDALPTAERNVLWMVIIRLVCAVGEPCLYETVTASVECGGHKFSAQGRTVLKNGWKAIDAEFRASLKEKPEAKDDEEDERDGPLPDLRDGQAFPSVAASVREGKTRPPKRFTEATLLTGMESAGSENPSVAERRGLGTPATRAGVIEKLIKSGFLERKKKLLVPSEKGSNLIAILPEDLKSPSLTADWEQKLKEVELGHLSAAAFMEDIEALTKGLVAAHAAPIPAYAHLFAQPPKGGAIGNCPRCGSAVTEAPQGFFCSNRACRFVLWKDARFWAAKGKKLDKKIAAALLNEGSVFFSDLKSEKTGKTYAATIILEDDGQQTSYRLDFNTNENGRKSA